LFYNVTATTNLCPLSLHDALPISILLNEGEGSIGQTALESRRSLEPVACPGDHIFLLSILRKYLNQPKSSRISWCEKNRISARKDRKSTRLNSSHVKISYADFCLK